MYGKDSSLLASERGPYGGSEVGAKAITVQYRLHIPIRQICTTERRGLAVNTTSCADDSARIDCVYSYLVFSKVARTEVLENSPWRIFINL